MPHAEIGTKFIYRKNISSPLGDIKWEYIIKLGELQEKEELTFCNRLTSRHILYKNKIMNVRLAAQVLSSSVEDALD